VGKDIGVEPAPPGRRSSKGHLGVLFKLYWAEFYAVGDAKQGDPRDAAVRRSVLHSASFVLQDPHPSGAACHTKVFTK